jgi:WD40 repeat protein
VDVTPDGRWVASAAWEHSLCLWNAADGTQVRTPGVLASLERYVNAGRVRFTPDGKALAAVVLDRPERWSVHFWDVATGKAARDPLTVGKGGAFVLSPDGSRLAVGGDGVRVWDLRRNRQVREFRFDRTIDDAWGLAFSPDGKLLAVALHAFGRDEEPSPLVRVFEVDSGREVFAAWRGRHVNAVAFSPDGKLLAAAGEIDDGLIRLWDLATHRQVRSIRADANVVFCLAFAPDGKTLASGGNTPAVKLWDVATGKSAGRLVGHTGQVGALAFAADGRTLVSAGGDKQVLVWRLGPAARGR